MNEEVINNGVLFVADCIIFGPVIIRIIMNWLEILDNKISSEIQKGIIRNCCPPYVAQRLCYAIDMQEKAKHFNRLLMEYNAWLVAQQQRQQMFLQRFVPRCDW